MKTGKCATCPACVYCLTEVSGDRISQQRLKFNMRVMAPMKETYKERFVAPELSMISYFMTKVLHHHFRHHHYFITASLLLLDV